MYLLWSRDTSSMLPIPEAIWKVNESESMTVTQYTWTSPEDSLEILLTHRLPTERWSSKIPKFHQTLLWNCVMNLRRFRIILSILYYSLYSSLFKVFPCHSGCGLKSPWRGNVTSMNKTSGAFKWTIAWCRILLWSAMIAMRWRNGSCKATIEIIQR